MTSDNSPSKNQVISEIKKNCAKSATIHGEKVVQGGFYNEQSRRVVEIWEIPPDKFRKEVVADDTGDGSEGHIVVMSDSDVRVYDPVSDTVNESEYDDSRLGSDGVTSSDLIDLIFDDAFNVEFEEIATVADRPAYQLSLTPRESADEFYQQYTAVQLWIDQEYAYPLRVNHNMTIQGEELTSEEMFEEVDFDAEFDESIFSLDY